MFSDSLSKIDRAEVATNILGEVLQKLHDPNYVAAQVLVAIARQALEDLQLDFDHHF